MKVRCEIAKPRRETSARSREDPMRTRAVRRGSEGRARWPKARRSSGSAIAAEVFMNNAGYSIPSIGLLAVAYNFRGIRPAL